MVKQLFFEENQIYLDSQNAVIGSAENYYTTGAL